ncbi:DUF1501 domain-containing protein [Mesorhizobium sp. B2-5-9]|uniref:DUF1501 domain-containing protein n=1 Tax=unclassified Mesorhizobium TaxID=325217 RepID=UPI00112A2DE1|nr:MULTISPECIES: DUF1501 domain-containing protein [unclassified Mesorhizobium]MBZ9697935.1 DUF1501 domain-containing protein [Mesorhizobium sp. CO1-1-9]TPK08292.1 DUF1501 domain-containing protein [Mesorhizobium sp. B2-5-7]TPK24512.1 DUF1501 domain-containing protein [Mesorhizobium sp. B2-5-9]TPK87968.1 DUF1501 domain-containing protein [Mesorhizobium sp. B2-4-13]
MSLLCETPHPSRRAVLTTGGALFAWSYLPRFARAADNRDPRLIVIVLRGALDGLSTVGPVGDPDYAGLHGDIALSLTGPHAALPLDAFFAVNPAMPVFARLFKNKQAAVVHAAATGYRERSHFDGQDVLESGFAGPGHVATGWLNRALENLPAGDRVATLGGLAVGPSTPLVIRGAAPVLGWAPQSLPAPAGDLAARVLDLYQHRDPVLAVALQKGLDADRMALDDQMGAKTMKPKGGLDSAAGMRQAAQGAARLIAADDGPRVAALAFDGWDTHVNEGGATGRLASLLGGLDGAFEEFKKGLGERWKDTAIVTITEFGRTARVNGTVGTDHGTGTVVLLAGGAIKGGRVIADWPGLKPAQLYQQRDLAPTSDVRAVLKGLLADQFGLSASVLGEKVFPDSGAVKPMMNLIA